ncbi:MAG TPA: ferric reductase-like transmembrane domain-containing protein [Solirubrobacteraceae bacterium]|nr:ferric reductase-like transmembrane domain-containing protein [Solirubrobacteraceae bacterium]
MTIAAVTPSPLWFMTRGTGTTALVLLTASVALGVAHVRRVRIGGLPRFVLDNVHRNVSLLALAFVCVHVATAVLDGFAPISLLDAVIPLHSAYRPVWLGLGAVAFDLLVATIVTSLLRRRLGYRAWRATHWLTYACWPVALVHAFGTGSDARTHWMLALTACCVLVVLAAVVVRVRAGWPHKLGVRLSALGMAAALPVGLAVWLPRGPLARGWALRAGTPLSVLEAAAGLPAAGRSGSSASAVQQRNSSSGEGDGQGEAQTQTDFTASVAGSVRQFQSADGQAVVDLSLGISGQGIDRLRIVLRGQPLPGGGVQLTSSRVTLGSQANPDLYAGQVTGLQGTTIGATVTGDGSTLSILAQLTVAPGPGAVTGTVTVAPAEQ